MAFEEAVPEEFGVYVPALFAGSLVEAEEYRQLLEDHDIPAVVDEEFESDEDAGDEVAVLVPETMLANARAFIAEIDELEGFTEDEEDLDDEDEEEEDELEDGQEDDELLDEEEEDEEDEDEEDEKEDDLEEDEEDEEEKSEDGELKEGEADR